MAKSRVSQMSLEDIFAKVGALIGVEQLKYALIEIKGSRVFECKKDEVVAYLREHEKNIDKERLVFCMAINLDKSLRGDLRKMSLKVQRETWRCYENAKELLKDVDAELPSIIEKDGRTEIEYFYSVDEFLNRVKAPTQTKQKNEALLKEMKDNQMLGKVLSNICVVDFKDCLCYYSGNGEFFESIVQDNFHKLLEDAKSMNKVLKKDFSKEELEQLENLAYLRELADVIERYSDKFDIEKLMLLSAYRAKEMLKGNKIEIWESENCVQVMEYVSQKMNSQFSMSEKVLGLWYQEQKSYMQYSTKELKEDLKRIATSMDGRKAYFGNQQVLEMKKAVLTGEQSLNDVVQAGAFPLLKFSAKEKQELMKQEAYNFELLVAFDALTSEEIKEALEILEGYKVESIDYLYDEKLIDQSDLIKMYMKNQMDLGRVLQCHELYHLEEEVNVEELMRYFGQRREDESRLKDFERYALLFREIKLKGQEPEVQSQISDKIVEKIYETEGEYAEDFKKLYQSDLLPIRTLMDWNGEEIVYDLIANQQLKPRDAKDLLMTKELNLEKVYKFLKNSHMSEEEKMNFIFSSFDGTGENEEEIRAQNEARMYLIQAVRISKDIVCGEKTGSGKERRNVAEGVKRNQYVTDPVYRWQLFSQMDSNCTSKAYLDGTVVFTLPNVKNGIVVIEKMYKATQEGTKINYGSATYVMSEEEFLNHKSEIEQDKKTNRKVLIQLMEEGKADKVIHSESWGKGLKKNLGFSVESGYSEEKMAKIDELVERIERARELVR